MSDKQLQQYDVEAKELGILDRICERIDGHNRRLEDLRALLMQRCDRILGPIPQPEVAPDTAALPQEDSALAAINARLQLQNSLLVEVEKEASRLSEL